MVRRDQWTGAAALASGVLMTVGVEGEWLLDPQRDDGTVTNVPLLAVLMVTSTAGFVLLLTAVRGLRAQMVRPTVPARAGALMAVVGAALLVAFGVLGLGSLLLTGSVLELSFLAFLLGMLLLSVGTVMWGLTRRWSPTAPGVRPLLLASGAGAFGALAVEPDPWHDIALVTMFASWSVLGVLLLRQADHAAPQHRSNATSQRV